MYKRLFTLTIATLLLGTSLVSAADHLDAPAVMAAGKANVDVNDLYAFQSPNDSANSVLILTVNPIATTSSNFGTVAENILYQFKIDNTGDAMANVTYGVEFTGSGAAQTYTVSRNGSPYIETTNVGAMSSASTSGGIAQTGLYDDPFFFDLAAFQDSFNFTDPGTDFFAGLDVLAIALEVPSSELNGASSNVGVWATTETNGMQDDRIGRPAINTALVPTARKDEFNQGVPSDDFADFNTDVNTAITSLGAADPAGLTATLLPDVLTFDTSNAGGFLNGRGLTDDVIDAELGLLTNGAVASDFVSTTDIFLTTFPYLATANVPEPASAGLTLLGLLVMCGFARRRKD